MATFNPINPSKQHYKYLGWSVDCRKPEQEWTESLQHYDGRQIRDLDKDDKNINIIPRTEIMSIEEMQNKSKGGNLNGEIDASSIGINAKFHVEVIVKHVSKEQTNTQYRFTRTATLQANIGNDPNTITLERNGQTKHHYSLFEQVLSNYILEFIEGKQGDPSCCHGKRVRDLQGENSITKLDDYTNDPMCQWRLIADACTSFVEEHKCTHYVYSITLGTQEEEKVESRDSQLSGSGGGGAAECPKGAKAEGKMGSDHSVDGKSTQKCTKGEAVNNIVTKEEVIEWHLKPVSSLICKESKNLRCIMEKLLMSYAEIKHGEESGPYIISCRDTAEREIYWQVVNREIHGTTAAEQASEFYLKYIREDPPELCIIHEKPSSTRLRVRFTESLNLELSQSSTDISEISFVLQTPWPVHTKVRLPATPSAIEKEGPFFIKKSEKGGLIQWILKKFGYTSATYIGMEKITNGKYKTVSHKQTNKEYDSLMLFTMTYKLTYDKEQQPLRAQAQPTHSSLLWQVGGVIASALLPLPLNLASSLWDRQTASGAVALPSRQSQQAIEGSDFQTLVGENYDFPIQVHQI